MKKLIIIISCIFLLCGCEGRAPYQVISQKEAVSKLADGAILIDVRTPYEYKEGHIEGAISLPNDTIEVTITKKVPDKNASIIVYCRSGSRSKEAANTLLKLGYQNVYDFGAMENWVV